MREILHALGLAVVCATLMVLAAPVVVALWLGGATKGGWRYIVGEMRRSAAMARERHP
jgi:hypothetical protein